MKPEEKTKKRYAQELAVLRQRLKSLETSERKCRQTEKSLHKEIQRVQKYLDIAGVILVAINRDQKVTFINKKGCSILGYRQKEVIGRNWFDTFLPERVRKEAIAVFANLIGGKVKEGEYFENLVLTRKGEEKIITWHNTLLTDESGNIIETLSSGEDITERTRAEKALRESEERLRSFVEFANDAIFFVDSSGIIRFWNQKAEQVYGYRTTELVGKPFSLLVPKQAREIHKIWMEKFLSLNDSEISGKVVEGIGERKDGSEFNAESSTAILRREGTRYLVVIVRDITERKKAEQRLQESEERFRTISQSSPDAIISADHQGNILSWNKGAKNIFGYDEEEVVGKPVQILLPERFREASSKAMEHLRQTGFSPLAGTTVEKVYLRKDGTEFPVEISRSFWKIGDRTYLSSIIRDISERKRAEEIIREKEERYRLVAEQTGQLIYDYDIASGVIQWAGAISPMTDYTPEEFQKVNITMWEELIHPDDRKHALAILNSSMKKGAPYNVEYRFRRKDGAYFNVEDNGVFLNGEDGKAYRMLGTMQDITERKRYEEELRTLSTMDGLTRLYNRRTFMELARQQLKLADRMKKGLSLLFIDLDGLKWINDNLGHQEGDKALMSTAKVLQETFRASDIIARIGGDEFSLLAINTDEGSSGILASRIQENLKKFNSKSKRPYKLSLSFGMVYYDPGFPSSIEKLLAMADRSMYEQKKGRKDSETSEGLPH